jgi:putative glutamine amidotransferase
MRPIIGLTSQPKHSRSAAGDIDSHVLAHTYTDSVLRVGGLPVLLVPVPGDHIDAVIDHIDGLVLTGGGDVDPGRYGETSSGTVSGVDFDRDEFELELARRALLKRLPTLAICRGLQVLNVALGGTLIQDIATEVGSMDHHQIGHLVYDGHQRVRLDPGCLVSKVVGTTQLMVNSIHHQAIKDTAPGLRAVGWAADGIIEAIEHDDRDWTMLGVQWHPEYLGETDDEASFALFSSLIEAARSVGTRV